MKVRIALGAALLALTVGGILAFELLFLPEGPNVRVEIPEGVTASQMVRTLHAKGVIRHPLLFRAIVKLTGTGRKLRPGSYTLRRPMKPVELLRKLQTGEIAFVKITIPEGWRAEEIAERLAANKITGYDDFISLVRDRGLEGYLYPTTYFLEEEMPAERVVEVMTAEHDKRIQPLLAGATPPLNLSPEEVVTLASIVQREAVVSTEKPLIAAVYLNRLKKRMRLEADPTVQYALGWRKAHKTWWKKRILYKDLEVKSPYNMYRNRGLPPGPICSPDAGSVNAVLHPADIRALYFVADATGRHTFNETHEEHEAAKQKWKRELRRQRQEAMAQEAAP